MQSIEDHGWSIVTEKLFSLTFICLHLLFIFYFCVHWTHQKFIMSRRRNDSVCQAAVDGSDAMKIVTFPLMKKPLINDYGILRLNLTIRETF